MDLSNLQQQLENLLSSLTGENYQDLFKSGFQLIVDFKNCGGNQQETYDKILPLFEKYQNIDEQKSALVADWLDCICGWVGNKDWCIWNEQQLP